MLKLEHIYDVEVVVAEDGKQAYDIVKESMDKGQYFNLIFMDIQVSTIVISTVEGSTELMWFRCLIWMGCRAHD